MASQQEANKEAVTSNELVIKTHYKGSKAMPFIIGE